MESRSSQTVHDETGYVSTTDSSVVWRLALPVLAENLLAMFVGWSDTILTGQFLVSDEYLAAITVCGYLLWLLECFAALIATGAHAVVARLIGARDLDQANHIVQQALLMAFLLGLGLLVGVLTLAAPMTRWLNLTGPAALLAAEYLRWIAICCPLMTVMLVAATCLRAAGHTLAGMWIVAAVNLVNIALSWSLVLGVGPLPRLGWTGIALGTAMSFAFGGLLALYWLVRGYREIRLPRQKPMLRWPSVRRVLRIGIPGAANSLAIVLCQLWFLAVIANLGDAAVAAHGVAIRCESVSWLTADAFAVAAATLVGQSLGAQDARRSVELGYRACRIGVACLAVYGVCFYFFADVLFAIFVRGGETEVYRIGVPVLKLVAFAMPALAVSIVLSGALRGAGDTRWPFVYNSASLLGLRIPLAYLFTGPLVGWGLYGAWIGMVVDLYARATASLLRYRTRAWTRLVV